MHEEFFYSEPNNISTSHLKIVDDEALHISKVLRKSVGDFIFVVDGVGNTYQSKISEIKKTDILCEIISVQKNINEPSIEVTLAFSLLKNPSRIDFIIEKCTELGVTKFIPVITQRTISKTFKFNRLKQITISAMKQSGRSRLPEIEEIKYFNEFVNSSDNYDLKLIPHEQTEITKNIRNEISAQKNLKRVLICIGPEGGFTDEEILLAEKNNFKTTSLGKRRLRAETAAIASVALVTN